MTMTPSAYILRTGVQPTYAEPPKPWPVMTHAEFIAHDRQMAEEDDAAAAEHERAGEHDLAAYRHELARSRRQEASHQEAIAATIQPGWWRKVGSGPMGPSREETTREHGPFELLVGGRAIRAMWTRGPTPHGFAWAWFTMDGRFRCGFYTPEGWRPLREPAA